MLYFQWFFNTKYKIVVIFMYYNRLKLPITIVTDYCSRFLFPVHFLFDTEWFDGLVYFLGFEFEMWSDP